MKYGGKVEISGNAIAGTSIKIMCHFSYSEEIRATEPFRLYAKIRRVDLTALLCDPEINAAVVRQCRAKMGWEDA